MRAGRSRLRSRSKGLTAPGYLSYVYDPVRDGSDLVVIDASDFRGKPVAPVQLPQRVPYGFHGNWIAG
jgi:carotenoid cleavage dioxygenase